MTKILIDEATVKLALDALEYIANETYDPWTNGAEAGRIAQTTLSKIKNKCRAIQTSDQMTCECGNVWDMNDPYPPKCTALREAPAGHVKETQKIEHEPAQQELVVFCMHWEDRWGCNHYADPKEPHPINAKPLYTSPPTLSLAQQDIQRLRALARAQQITIDKLEAQHTWVGLSSAERSKCLSAGDAHGWIGVMEATEAKLKEKNT